MREAGGRAVGVPPSRERLATVAAIYPASLVALSVVHIVWPQRAGLLAISQILAPHLFLLAVLVVPWLAVRRSRALRVAMGLALVVFVARFGEGAFALPVGLTDGARQEVVATWNVLSNGRDPSRTMEALRSSDASILAMQELSERIAGEIERDPALTARYPHRIFVPRRDVLGMGLLSSNPVLESGRLADPPLIWAVLDLSGGLRLTVVNAHPLPARIQGIDTIPTGFDPVERDASIGRVRALLDERLALGERVLLLGDLNITDRELAYTELASGLIDAQREVGGWPASTWRPRFAVEWPFGLLRIDYLLSGPGLRPLTVAPDCTPSGSDHCLVRGVYELVDLPPAR